MAEENRPGQGRPLDLTDEKDVAQLGLEAQKNISKLSDMLLTTIRKENMDGILKLLKQTIEYLDGICNEEEAPKRIFFAQTKKYDLEMKETYRDAERRIDVMAAELRRHQLSLVKNKTMLEQLEKMNRGYFDELHRAYQQGKDIVDEMDQWMNQLESSWPIVDREETQDYLRVRGQRKRLADRLQELTVSREISKQMNLQIHLLTTNEQDMVNKIQNVLLNTIALWKNHVVLLLEKGRGFAKEEEALKERNLELRERFDEILHLGEKNEQLDA